MAQDPTPKQATPPEVQGFRYWWGQLWAIMRKAILFSLAGLGLVLLIRFGGRSALIIIPVLILLFGTGLYAWLRIKMRKRK